MKSQDFYKQLKKQLNKTINGSKMINEEAMLYVQSAINHLFDKFDIVSREEFDAQKAVLERSRKKIVKLENQITELEIALENG